MATVTVTAAAAVDDDDDGTITTVVRRRNKTYALCKDKKLSLSLSLSFAPFNQPLIVWTDFLVYYYRGRQRSRVMYFYLHTPW